MSTISFTASVSAFAALLLFPALAGAADSVEDLMKKGADCDARLCADQALKCYLSAEKLEPNNADVLVQVARQYRHLMSDATKTDEKLRLGGIAVAYSRHAVALAPKNADAQLSLAISYGKLLPLQSTREQAENSRLIRAAADKVVALDPHNDLGWHVLGRWFLNMAGIGTVKRTVARLVYGELPPATNEDALRCFEKAIALNPNRLMHYIELGRTYAQMGRPVEARKFLTKGLAMADTEKDDPQTKNDGRELLAKLQ